MQLLGAGMPTSDLADAPFWQLFNPLEVSRQSAQEQVAEAGKQHSNAMLHVQHRQRAGGPPLLLRFMCALCIHAASATL